MRIWLLLLKSGVSKPPGVSSCAMTSRKVHVEERLREKMSREKADDKRGEFLILFFFFFFQDVLICLWKYSSRSRTGLVTNPEEGKRFPTYFHD